MTQLKYGKLNLIIASSPNNTNDFVSIIQKYKVTDLIRACDKQYDDMSIKSMCTIHECAFEDGREPPQMIIDEVLKVMRERFYSDMLTNHTVLIHCTAGLGRAPLLACIAMIICEKADTLSVVSYVRKHIRGALNAHQLDYLLKTNWKSQQKKFSKLSNKGQNGCIIC
jgi:protein tyrosine phosphatase type 4A